MHKRIQLVTEDGRPSGTATSPFDAIKQGRIRLVSRVVLTDGNDNFLLQKRAKDMRMYPDCWDISAAGHVDEGETPEQAAKRELREEIGLDIDLQFIATYYDSLKIKFYNMVFKSYSYIYSAKVDKNKIKIQAEPTEVAYTQWFSRSEVEKLIQNPEKCTDGLVKIFKDKLV